MRYETASWFSVSLPKSQIIICANCRKDIELTPFLDHHPSGCPLCGINCAYLDWKDRKIQILPQNAPEVFARMLEYLQKNSDELEYVELVGCFQEMADAIN